MAALPLLLLSAAAAQQADVFVNGQEGYACFRIPAVLQLPNGHLAVYVEGRKYSCSAELVLDPTTSGLLARSLPRPNSLACH